MPTQEPAQGTGEVTDEAGRRGPRRKRSAESKTWQQLGGWDRDVTWGTGGGSGTGSLGCVTARAQAHGCRRLGSGGRAGARGLAAVLNFLVDRLVGWSGGWFGQSIG